MQRDFSFKNNAPHICDSLVIFFWIAINFVPWPVDQVFRSIKQFISDFVREGVFIHRGPPASNKGALPGPRPDHAISSLGLVFLLLPSSRPTRRPGAF